MRILITLLALLLSSPVYAETYVCSSGSLIIDQRAYVRSGDHFLYQATTRPIQYEITYEDEFDLVLTRIRRDGEGAGELVTFHITIRKDERIFRHVFLEEERGVGGTFLAPLQAIGSCTVVE